ncbi:MAG: carbamoyltransferase HypF [Anaerolineales bacterium]|uniref:Carbamoyltransferase n=1 Tax=Candidatus Desulfolinea nitratireducens TaxID=2841698 RepID=A0A8J6TFI4_9CHLR|nr:carbamoyltransferase HypF [Candidatus Desulfolinea nitratireducens]MBL6961279.1 carbamoyltransferase HypF [Anaerolineales bacterium]
MTKQTGLRIHITGVVQGVGFRPFVYGLATRFQLNGWVRNTSAGVNIEVDGEAAVLDEFTKALLDEAPPLSLIDELTATPQALNGFRGFEIVHSEAIADAFQPISPDVSICPDCLRELFDPEDHRYRYPFINCTNCGPRFTIIKDIPYDRPETTMAPFPMCGTCASEYKDPLDRRFHAQPVACPDCGPKVWLEIVGANGRSPLQRNVAILETQKLLGQGKILAIKGLGGFHLACDATNAAAVSELRRRKLRVDKPFALMMPDIATVEKHCFLDETERELLKSIARPIVLLQRRPESPIAREIAPRQDSIGVMLPYTPLHYLIFDENAQFDALVMTSGNLSEEPIAYTNEDARERLSSLADAFLMHDRDIHIRCDDSVARVVEKGIYPLRRSRGYTPFPIKLPWEVPALLATGAELKNAFCITNQKYAFLSHHIGDLENYETLQSFEEGVSHFEKLFRVKPEAIAYDAHPNYLTTRYAQERTERDNVKTVAIQHHHAHIASCMAENGLAGDERVIGVALDGTGYGDDGNIWGGEFLLADYAGYKRVTHLEYFPLAGGDAATKRPSRTALGLLWQLGLDWDANLASVQDQCSEERMALRVQLERKLNTPLTSSMGRLFDAAAALAGVRQRVNYEAQAAIEFEALADDTEMGSYNFDGSNAEIRVRAAIESLIADSLNDVPIPVISARFHNGIVNMVAEICIRLREKSGLNTVALSGGVWQNRYILTRTLKKLREDDFEVLIHRQVPANDGGLALGQAAIASWKLK